MRLLPLLLLLAACSWDLGPEDATCWDDGGCPAGHHCEGAGDERGSCREDRDDDDATPDDDDSADDDDATPDDDDTTPDDDDATPDDDDDVDDDDAADDDDSTPDPEVAGYISSTVSWFSCPGCFGVDSTFEQSQYLQHDPVIGTWNTRPAPGLCSAGGTTAPTQTLLDVGASVDLVAPSHTITLDRAENLIYVQADAPEPGESSHLVLPSGDLLDVLVMPPLAGGLTPTAAFDPGVSPWTTPFSASNATVTWTASGAVSTVTIQIQVYDPNTSALLVTVTCVAPDTGSFTVPASVFNTFTALSPLAIGVHNTNTGSVPHSAGGTLETFGFAGCFGTAHLVP